MYITDLQNENVHQIIRKKHSHTLKKVLNQMSLNPKSLQINNIVYYSIENKPILIFVKDVRCEAQTPEDLKDRVRESYGTYSPRPGTGASQNASPRATVENKLVGPCCYIHSNRESKTQKNTKSQNLMSLHSKVINCLHYILTDKVTDCLAKWSDYFYILSTLAIYQLYLYEPPRGKTNNVVSEQVRHKPACKSTENS